MKVLCTLENLKSILSLVERGTAKNQSLKVLQGMYIYANKNTLTIRSTNLETAIEIIIQANVHEDGEVVVPAKTLQSFISNIKSDTVLLIEDKGNLLVETKTSKTTIRGFDSSDFPLFPKISCVYQCSLPFVQFSDGLSRVAIAASLSDIKPELSSIRFRFLKNTLILSATDSFRLAEFSIKSTDINIENDTTFLVPQKVVQDIMHIFDGDDIVSIGFSKNQFIVFTKTKKFMSRLIEGKFPEYESVIPKVFQTEVKIKREELLHHLKLSNVFAGKLNDITLIISSANKSIGFFASHPDIGEHNSEAKSDVDGEDISIKFNLRYLLDGITNVNSDILVLKMNSNQKPVFIESVDNKQYWYLAMPMLQ